MTTLAVSEIFGPTFQGEGPSLGKQAIFLRLSGCNLACSWCDTPYTWDWTGKNGKVYDVHEETRIMTLQDVSDEIRRRSLRSNDPILVITGGEPLLQQAAIAALEATRWFERVEIETNGTQLPSDELRARSEFHYNVSPKLHNSGNAIWEPFPNNEVFPNRKRIPMDIEKAMRTFAEMPFATLFKFVCQNKDDLDEVMVIRNHFNINDETIWIMPEGRTHVVIRGHATALADHVLANGWNMTTRLHVLLWGDERGK